MHELSAVEELVAQVRRAANGRRVLEVFVRCPAAVQSDEISECFSYVVEALGTVEGTGWLSSAELTLETVPVYFQCQCGYSGELGEDNIAGHIGVCPRCGQAREVDGSLELLGISYASGAD